MIALAVALLSLCAAVNAAPPTKDALACNDIENKSGNYKEAFESLLERLQNEIVNTGKFDVVDNKRLLEVADELAKVEDGLTDETPNINLRVAAISAHGSVLSMNVVSEEPKTAYNIEPRVKYIARMELTIRFQDMNTGVITASKLVKAEGVNHAAKKDIEKDKSRMFRWSRIVKPAVTQPTKIKSPAGAIVLDENIVTKEAEYEQTYIAPEEKIAYDACIQDAVKKVVEMLMEFRYPINVSQVSNGKVYISLPEERATDKMAEGAVFEVLEMGEEIIDFDTGESLGAEEECVMTIKIDTKRPKMAICVPVTGKENLPKVEEKVKQFIKDRSAEKNPVKQKQMKPPFQIRLIEGNKAADAVEKTTQPEEKKTSSIKDRFNRD